MTPAATSVCFRKLRFAATTAWTPWWLAEPSDLAAHTPVHTLGIEDKGPFPLVNPAFSFSPPTPPPPACPNIPFAAFVLTASLHHWLFFNSFPFCTSSHSSFIIPCFPLPTAAKDFVCSTTLSRVSHRSIFSVQQLSALHTRPVN